MDIIKIDRTGKPRRPIKQGLTRTVLVRVSDKTFRRLCTVAEEKQQGFSEFLRSLFSVV